MSVITCRSNLLRGIRKCHTVSSYSYVGGSEGSWEVVQSSVRCGEPLASVSHIEIIQGSLGETPAGASWILTGLVQKTRYVSREELPQRNFSPLPPTCAALICIRRKVVASPSRSASHEIISAQTSSIPRGLRSLSTLFRRWQHRCDLSQQFDCVTWFEYEPRDANAFDDLLADWRASEEWKSVDRECEVRLVRAS